ncbi:hypothetical protein [Nostoc sp. MG11]|nr:hypothetical protein [Nostoc sp. MG11]
MSTTGYAYALHSTFKLSVTAGDRIPTANFILFEYAAMPYP